MKIFAHHDPKGNIKGIVTFDARGNAGLMLSPAAGISVTEIEGVKFRSKTPTIEELQGIAKSYKISASKTKSGVEKK
jgi:hypothetical protein